MKEQPFSLVAFPDRSIPEIAIRGKISRPGNRLAIEYLLTGNLDSIFIPRRSLQPARKNELWTATCFEFFLARPGQAEYWEFNLSPSGDWNIYHMDAYRRVGFREETSLGPLPFAVRIEPDCISVRSTLDISPVLSEEHPIQAAITSIIQTRHGQQSYWALAHPEPQADFHVRESFIITL